ncbi:helix-turn-helix transcriptional regulator [Vreelandella neptunia]|uniref:HTH luxR-type domain-containing protein n=1 Tax=Vreelandella neptunia TaxID=115551 RepID=A0ABZ0YT26_9GAMM|nr:hypothetical protein [Halomonas neptunia]MDN3561682.1 hypothetical protein [Halomonas neptunia]WQH14584.1 hypothetical protein SR894_08605 [Halomonas neptunia]
MQSPTTQHVTFAGWRCQYGARKSGLPTLVQAQVAAGLAAGLTQKEIAKLRGVSPASVRTVAEALYSHLGAYRAAAAVAEGMKRGWIAPLLVALLISGINPDMDAMRHRQPTRTRTHSSVTARINQRLDGSLFA